MKFILFFAFIELSFALGPAGPLSVWHGESSLADAYSDSGYWSDDMKVEKMFDECGDTAWQSEQDFEPVEKAILVLFKV